MKSILKPNVQELQQDVLDLLQQIADLIARAHGALTVDGASHKRAQQEINQATRNVAELELRMAIIAPMKAGKSTIINSIIGQELLPSRHTAMTTLPTEIVFSELSEPTLTLSPKILSVFQTALMVLRWQFKVLGTERMQEKMAQYPYLLNLQELITKTGEPLRAKTTGQPEIRQALTLLNDMIRLCGLLNPAQDPLAQLIDLPCVETPLWQGGTDLSAQVGNLVIVDTPGSNEVGTNLKLAAVVEEQLQRSSMVLIVLDFTQLNNQAAEAVKEQVKPVLELLSKENLYVLVNKIDQRRPGDLSAEQVKEFVFADLGLSTQDRERVFEVSAIQAFSATRFLRERQQHPNRAVSEMESAKALAQEALGSRWETKLQRATLDDLTEEAIYLWEASGFKPFLERAICTLMENAAPRCMKSSLSMSRNLLLELREDLNLRRRAIAQDEARLHQEITTLEADLAGLKQGRDRLHGVELIQAELQTNLEEILAALQQAAQVSIEDYFMEDKYASQSPNLPRIIEVLVKPLAEFESFPQWISSRITAHLTYKSFGKFEFYTGSEAEEFAEQAVVWSKQRAEVLLAQVCQAIEKDIEKAWAKLTSFLVEETTPLLEQARSRLQKAFQIELLPLSPAFEQPEIRRVPTPVDCESKQIPDYTVKKYRPFYFFFLIKLEKKVPTIKTESYYTVSIEELAALINTAIEASIADLHDTMSQQLQEFQQQIDDYFMALEQYLRNYRDSLKQAQQEQQRSLEAEKQLVGTLDYLIPETTAMLKKAETYIERTNYLLNGR